MLRHALSRVGRRSFASLSEVDLVFTKGMEGEQYDMRRRMEFMVLNAQESICSGLEDVEVKFNLATNGEVDQSAKFARKVHHRPKDQPVQGGGVERVIQGGNVFEKGGLNTSVSFGPLRAPQLQHLRSNHAQLQTSLGNGEIPDDVNAEYFAGSMSMVIHGKNPFVPTVHLNYRYFELQLQGMNGPSTMWWYGGGCDLTPSYVDMGDGAHFHGVLKNVCDSHDPGNYDVFKKQCDEYFEIEHRKERRGIGGIFFDDLYSDNQTELFNFVKGCADSFLPSYVPIVERNMYKDFTPEQKEWQQIRRGRYAEFNLCYDRGTKFGLALPNPRTEAILMSLPQTCSWVYNHQVEADSPEGQSLEIFKNAVDFV